MPERVPFEQATFVKRSSEESGEDTPILLLGAGRQIASMPVISDEPEWLDPKRLGDWRLAAKLTLCVLDGPGEEGYLIGPVRADKVNQMRAWCELVDAHGGAWAFLLEDTTRPPETIDQVTFKPGRAIRGGFVGSV